MIRENQNNHKNLIRCYFAPGILSLIFVLLACMFVLCGCGGTDRYIEIVVAGGDAVVTPVPAMNKEADSHEKTVSATSAVKEETAKETAEEKKESITEVAAEAEFQPEMMAIPTVPPIEIPIFTPIIIATPEIIYTPVPVVTPAVSAAPDLTPVPTPDTEKIMRQELDDVYAEYSEEWDMLYKEYETKCAIALNSLNSMGPPSDDPEYIAEYARLSGLLDTYEKEFKSKVEELDAVYFEKYSAVYDKYGR